MVDSKHELFTEDKLKIKSSFHTLPLIPAMHELLLEQQRKQENYRVLFKCSCYTDYRKRAPTSVFLPSRVTVSSPVM